MARDRARGRLSWFPMYWADFLEGTAQYPPRLVGQYLLLLGAQFASRERCAIPAKADILRTICRGEDPDPSVLEKFYAITLPDGLTYIRNKRMYDVWQAAFSEYRAKSGGGGRKDTGAVTGAVSGAVSAPVTGAVTGAVSGVQPQPEPDTEPKQRTDNGTGAPAEAPPAVARIKRRKIRATPEERLRSLAAGDAGVIVQARAMIVGGDTDVTLPKLEQAEKFLRAGFTVEKARQIFQHIADAPDERSLAGFCHYKNTTFEYCLRPEVAQNLLDEAARHGTNGLAMAPARASPPMGVDARNTDAIRKAIQRRTSEGSGAGGEVHNGPGADRKGVPPGS